MAALLVVVYLFGTGLLVASHREHAPTMARVYAVLAYVNLAVALAYAVVLVATYRAP